jgi:hypothetical protein
MKQLPALVKADFGLRFEISNQQPPICNTYSRLPISPSDDCCRKLWIYITNRRLLIADFRSRDAEEGIHV